MKGKKKYFKRILLFLWLRCMSKFCVNNIFLININIYIHIQRHFTSVLCSTFYHEWKWHIPRKGFDLLQSVLSSLVKLGFSRKGNTYILWNRPTFGIYYIYISINYLSNGKGKLSRMGFTWSSNEIHYLIMRVCWNISSIY